MLFMCELSAAYLDPAPECFKIRFADILDEGGLHQGRHDDDAPEMPVLYCDLMRCVVVLVVMGVESGKSV